MRGSRDLCVTSLLLGDVVSDSNRLYTTYIYIHVKLKSHCNALERSNLCETIIFKVSGPFVETPRIFLCMQNINYAEILA